QDDHGAAFAAFLQTCTRLADHLPRHRPNGVDPEALRAICAQAQQTDITGAQAFFEHHFTPYEVGETGVLTGYYEPEHVASPVRTDTFRYPLYRLPENLVELPAAPTTLGIEQDVTWGRRTASGYEAFPDRAAIMAGALEGQGLEIAWLADPVDAFFIHIQGSARLAMTDGSVLRVNFAGKSGHAYTAIGRTLVQQGAMALEDVTMQSLRGWLASAPDDARDAVLATNRSFIFFAATADEAPHLGPFAAAGVPLTPGRSLAVDRHLHTFGSPIFVTSPEALPGGDAPLRRLMIAQDTGSAIVGPARGDLFVGSGEEAGALAGSINMPVGYIVLVPKQHSHTQDAAD
ncbi:MAG: MltA domain-containing protein, partial [Devosiaceae bacterium]|nr:MltA domain-containing protein [Devosiaceae bacterium MH13]